MSLSKKSRDTLTAAQVSNQLRSLALSMQPHEKLPTMTEMCEQIGTSRATLSEALDELELQQVIYRQQSKGIFISPHIDRKTICIIFDSSLLEMGASSFWGNLLSACTQLAQQRAQTQKEYHSIHLIIRKPAQDSQLPEEVMHMIQTQRVHGVLSIGLNTFAQENVTHPISVPKTTTEVLTQSNIPAVTFAAFGRWMIAQDYQHLIWLCVHQLAQQGCQKIGLWTPVYYRDNAYHKQQYDIFPYFLAGHQLTYDPAVVKDISSCLPLDSMNTLTLQEQGYLLAKHIFGDPDVVHPDGLVIIDDMMMEGAFAAFHQLGVQLGKDVTIATHANAGSLRFFDHLTGVTVIEFDPNDIAQALFSTLDILLAGQVPAEMVIKVMPRLRRHSSYLA